MRRECGRFAVLSNSEYVRVRKPNTLFNIIYIMRIRLPLNEMIGQRPLEASNQTEFMGDFAIHPQTYNHPYFLIRQCGHPASGH